MSDANTRCPHLFQKMTTISRQTKAATAALSPIDRPRTKESSSSSIIAFSVDVFFSVVAESVVGEKLDTVDTDVYIPKLAVEYASEPVLEIVCDANDNITVVDKCVDESFVADELCNTAVVE